MRVEIIKCLQDNFSYLIIDEKTMIACVVDPSEATPIIKLAVDTIPSLAPNTAALNHPERWDLCSS